MLTPALAFIVFVVQLGAYDYLGVIALSPDVDASTCLYCFLSAIGGIQFFTPDRVKVMR